MYRLGLRNRLGLGYRAPLSSHGSIRLDLGVSRNLNTYTRLNGMNSNTRINSISRMNSMNLQFRRNIRIPTPYLKAANQWGAIFNFLAACYFGGLVVCLGLLYWLYSDADLRQNIPFELKFSDQKTAVEAINKDDVCKSPQYAAKHYRRLLIDLASREDPENVEQIQSGNDSSEESYYDFPMIKPRVLLHEKSNTFANFYMDIILRYAKALLSRGKEESCKRILKKIVNNDELFYNLGNAESLAEDCRFLAKLHEDDVDAKVAYLLKSIDMLTQSFPSIQLEAGFMLKPTTKVTNQLLACLNDLAFTYAQQSKVQRKKAEKDELLADSLNIYLANLLVLTDIQTKLANGTLTKRLFPLFNVNPLSLKVQIAEIKAHISEIIWAKGYKKNAIGWGEDVVDSIYYEYNDSSSVAPILLSTLNNLAKMYGNLNDNLNKERCLRMTKGIDEYDGDPQLHYETVLANFSKIIYSKGPLGIIEKSLKERYGPTRFAPDLEEFDVLDEEDVNSKK